MTGLAPSAAPLSASSLAQLTFSLLAIVGLIFAIAWAIRRFRLAAPRGRGGMVIVGELPVSARERILLIRVGDSQVLVAVGGSGIVGLTPLSTPITLQGTPPAAPFAERLRDYMRRPEGLT